MNTAFDILVIALSALLGIFLILSITAAIIVLKLVRTIKRIVAKAENVVDSAEVAAEIFKNVAGPMGVVKLLVNLVDSVGKHKRGKHHE